MMSKALFIAVEGIEGVGKTTLIQEIATRFEREGRPFVVTREPGGTPLAEELRNLLKSKTHQISPMTELLLMFASRSQHIEALIKPKLQDGVTVISDRYVAASYAYQGGGRQLDMAYLHQLDQMVCGDIQPDLTLLLTAPVEQAMKRVASRAEKDRIEEEAFAFFERAQQTYLDLAKDNPHYQIIDASQALESVIQALHTILDNHV